MSTPYGLSPTCSSIHLQLDLELLGREADRAEHAEAARLRDRGDDVAAVGEGEDRELDAEAVAELGVHGRPSRKKRRMLTPRAAAGTYVRG